MDEDTENQIPIKDKTVSRRKFLQLTSALVGVGTLGACKIIDVNNTTPTPNIKIQLPDVPSAETLLKQTATAIEQKGEKSSFVEQAGFSKELFEKARQGTFLLTEVANDATRFGTTWLAESDGNIHYFVTNKHVVNGRNSFQLRAVRPYIDKQPFIPENISYAVHQNRDLAVMKCIGDFKTEIQPTPLKWQDDYSPNLNDEALLVGYPYDFHSEDEMKQTAKTSGEVVIINKAEPNLHWWRAKAILSGGSSGSPAVIEQDGQPLVIGTASGGNLDLLDVDDTHIQKQLVAVVYKLDIGQLINALKRH
jgi:hypothetical protein